MSKGNAVKAILLLWTGTIFGAVCAFLTQVIAARALGPEGYGELSAGIATVTLISPLAAFGIQGLLLKIFGEEGIFGKRWLKISFRLFSISTATTALIVLAWSNLGPHTTTTSSLLNVLMVHVLGIAVVEMVSAKYLLEEKHKLLSLWQTLPNLLRLILVSTVLFSAGNNIDPFYIACCYAAVSALIVIVSIRPLGQLYKGDIALPYTPSNFIVPTPATFGNFFKNCFPFGAAGILFLIYFQSDIALLKYLVGNHSAGIYNTAFTILGAIYLLPNVIYGKYLLPKLHRWANHDRTTLYRVYKQGNKIMLSLGALSAASLLLVAPFAIPIVFGQEYKTSVTIVMILAFCIPFRFLSTSVGSVLTTNNQMSHKVKCMSVVAGINILLNLILIPSYQEAGAAYSTLACEAILLILYYTSVKKRVFYTEQQEIKP